MQKKTAPTGTCASCGRIYDAALYPLQPETKTDKNHVLLHSCCGPCSTACIERLLPDYRITIFFYNPNVTDPAEYARRKEAQIQFLTAYNERLPEEDRVQFIEGEYLPEDFFAVCSALADEPEGGKRCTECFRLRMDRTAQVALKTGHTLFGTTLTVSPHKNYPLISAIGTELARVYGLEFLDLDFKKKAGFQRSIELSKEYGLYRQNYCGCAYSMRHMTKQEEDKNMLPLILPENYESPIDLMESQRAIKKIKDYFQQELAYGLNLRRVSAPLFVDPKTGLNDNLNGVERRVSFTLKDINELEVEVVQSLAKWKRMALGKYGIEPGHGIYTDMNAIRRDEELDNLHSVYVDQWDWEKVITKEQRTETYLRETVTTIYNAIKNLGDYVNRLYRNIQTEIPNEIFFITTQELEDMYPDKTPKEREDAITKEHGAVFIMKIGGQLASGQKHDGRSPDYDDWELNGDIILWNEVLDRAFEISSMGIRVDADAMKRQLAQAGCPERAELPFQKAILNDELPYTIGGGIGQSRLCMYFRRKAHIGEVQASVWPQEMIDKCAAHHIYLL